jgi:PPOX class probable F420-dependent enzyme
VFPVSSVVKVWISAPSGLPLRALRLESFLERSVLIRGPAFLCVPCVLCGEGLIYNALMPIPPELRGHKYILLTTFRKAGTAVPTPVWFAQDKDDDKLYVKTRADSGKTKRIRNHPQVRVAPCNFRGKVTGPEFSASARILPPQDWPSARQAINQKYWMARLSLSKKNTYLEISAFTS